MLSALYLASFITSNPFRGISYTRTRGRNAHKKRANIRRKSELTKHFALIFKQLRVFSLTHEMLAQRLYQHFTTKKTRFWPPEVQTTRDVHIAHHPIVEPRATTYTTPNVALPKYPARDFQHSAALFLTPRSREVITLKMTLSSTTKYAILAHHTHIRLSLLTQQESATSQSHHL